VDFITIDACELINYSIDKLDDSKVVALYESNVEQDVRRELKRNYVDKTFSFLLSDRQITVCFKRRCDKDCVKIYEEPRTCYKRCTNSPRSISRRHLVLK